MAEINLSGSIGGAGFPILGSANVVITDADYTLTVNQYTNQFITITSSVSLTQTRKIYAPLTAGVSYIVQNNTSGAHQLLLIGSTGRGVYIDNGSSALVINDGVNYFSPNAAAITTAGGDLSGTYPNPTVIALQGNYVASQTLGSGQNNYALVWDSTDGYWAAKNVFLNQSAGGNLGDFYPNPTVRSLWNAAIPQVIPSSPTSTAGFVVGNVLQVTSTATNNPTLGYGALNLSNVTGTLSASNQAYQSTGGDLSGLVNNVTVTKIQNIPIEHVSLGIAQDGYVLTYSYTDAQWEPKASTTGASLSGDVTGSITSTNVAKLQGYNLSIGTPTTGQMLTYNGSAFAPQTLSISLIGDVTGTLSSGSISSTVDKIQNNPVKPQSLGTAEDGYVLTWINTDGKWEAIPNSGGSGAFVAGGDLSGSSVDQTVIKINGTSVPASPTAGNVLVATSGTASSWSQITNSSISPSANITGSKIDFSYGTGGINSIFASNTIQAPSFIATTQYFIGSSSGPNITAGTGAPSGTPAGGNGSIYLRKDGTSDGTESIYSYEAGTWAPVGAAAAGSAGGDLSGFYPNPTVIAIQKNPIDSTLLTSSIYDGYVLTWSYPGNVWKAKPAATFVAGGDLTGTTTSQNVVKIQNKTLSSSLSSIGSTQDGYVLTWVNASSDWEAKPSSGGSSFTAGGDLSGTNTSQNVIKINGASVPASGALTTGNLLQVTGTSTLTYGALNLAGGSNYVSGLLPSTNQASQTLGGDLSGTTASGSVIALRGKVLNSSLSSLGASQDGYFLTWVNASSDWEAKPGPSGSFSAGGDLSGTSTSQTVTGLQGRVVASTAPTDTYVLTWNAGASHWQPSPGGGGSSGPIIQDGGSLGANIRLNTTYASAIDNTQSGIVNFGEATIGAGTIGTITNVTGSGTIITVTVSGTLPAFLFAGAVVVISGVVGTTEVNGQWQIVSVATNSFNISNGPTFVHTYISGGIVKYPAPGVYGKYSASLSGDQNYVDGYYNVIVGGANNYIGQHDDGYSTIVGGLNNTIYCLSPGNYLANTIVGGIANIIGEGSSLIPDLTQVCYAEGYANNINSGSAICHVEGESNQIIDGNGNHVEGQGNTIAIASDSHIEGVSNGFSYCQNTHIEGQSNYSGYSILNCHIEGFSNTIAGPASEVHIEGNSNTVNYGDYSHVEGTNCVVGAEASHVQGEYASSVHEGQNVRAAGKFAAAGDAQVSDLVLRAVGTGTILLNFGLLQDQVINLVAASGTYIIEATAQDLVTGDYASFVQTHLVYGLTSIPNSTYVGCSPYFNSNIGAATFASTTNGGPPIIATTGTASPYTNWTLTAGIDSSGNLQFTFADSVSTDNISIVANVRFIENNSA